MIESGVSPRPGVSGPTSDPTSVAECGSISSPLPFGWVPPTRQVATWLTLIACGLIVLARMPDRILNPQLYAEDALFYADALKFGGWALLRPYGGYLLVMPRLASWVAVHLPVLWVPAFFNVGALLLALVVLARLFSPRVALSHKPWLALAVVLLPHIEDLFMVMENIQWILSLGLVLVLISADPATPAQRRGDSAMALLFGLTGVFSIILAPLYVLRALERRSRDSLILAGLVGAAAFCQAWFVIHGNALHGHPPIAFDPGMIPALLGFRLIAHLFGGQRLLELSSFGLTVAGVIALGLCGWTLSNGRVSAAERRVRQMLVAVLIVQSAASLYRFHDLWTMLLSPEHLGRYFFLPELVFVWILLTEYSSGGLRRILAAAAAVAFLMTAFAFFRCAPLTDYQWPHYAAIIQQRTRVDVPINPQGWHFLYTRDHEIDVFGAPSAPPAP